MVDVRSEKGGNMKLYTMGTGVLKGSHIARKLAFQDRLKGIRKEIGLGLIVADIRQILSKSRNGKWCYQSPTNQAGMWQTLEEIGIPYWDLSILANHHGNTKKGFAEYRFGLTTCAIMHDLLAEMITAFWQDYVLLCSERQPFKPSGAPNCHRVILAEELLKRLGEAWEIVHL